MDNSGDWVLSPETEERFSRICSEFESDKFIESSKAWFEIFYYGSPPIGEINIQILGVYSHNVENNETIETVALIKESLESNQIFSDSIFIGLSYNSINKILVSLSESLTESEFSGFCKCIASWENDALVEESLRLIVLPKLKENKEASASTVFSIKELAASKPESLCHCVLVPLLTDESFHFSDVGLLDEVYQILNPPQKDLIIEKLTNKKNFTESDWLLLQSLAKDLSRNSVIDVISCICNFSRAFTKSQVFGRFLVSFLKTLDSVSNKELLLKVIDKHETLFKNHAIRYLTSIAEDEYRLKNKLDAFKK